MTRATRPPLATVTRHRLAHPVIRLSGYRCDPMAQPSFDFCFDFISPYAYIAWFQAQAVAARNACIMHPVPVLFAGLLDAHGTRGPAEIPAKRLYTFRDAYRKAHRLGLPRLVPPPSHPFNPLLALRVASLPLPPDERRRLVDELFAATWATGGGVESEEAVSAAADRAGLDGRALVAAARTPETKALLREATARAVARGVFGVPTIVVGDEVFWGTDGVEHAEICLRGEDPVPKDLAWADRPASAVRPGSL
ncbi:MAG: 2-hydroxychromene-2-carboxylate isomerase [Labilithrix sp.]|nr:2-hydroxychromene-2-carboxylate isomerase [Labilithrix sp.]